MRAIWTVISVFCLANVLAIAGFVGWLRATDRLNIDRVREVREAFTETIAARKAREADEKSKVESDLKAAEEATKKARPPISAMEQLSLRLETNEAERQRNERARQEIEALRQALLKERAGLDAEKAALETARKDFEEMRKRIAEQEGADQFKKTLTVLQSLKPDEVRATLQQIMDGAKDGTGRETAIGYLNALPDRNRTKVLSEFIKSDPKLAADLLEGLRMRGQAAPPPEAQPG